MSYNQPIHSNLDVSNPPQDGSGAPSAGLQSDVACLLADRLIEAAQYIEDNPTGDQSGHDCYHANKEAEEIRAFVEQLKRVCDGKKE